jgi:nitrate/TMAO reductase-like tetraheme cytochrome c subunit
MKAKEEGKTCIDCHKGIAHQLPKEYEEPDD